jgi:hypothetical protein
MNVLTIIAKIGSGSMIRLERTYAWLTRLLFVLWHCRLSLVSCVLGFVLMAAAPPVWDLFADRAAGIGTQAALLGIVLLAWAAPVYLSAQYILLDRVTVGRLVRSKWKRTGACVHSYRRMVRFVPIALGFACVVATCFGVDEGRSNFAAATFRKRPNSCRS